MCWFATMQCLPSIMQMVAIEIILYDTHWNMPFIHISNSTLFKRNEKQQWIDSCHRENERIFSELLSEEKFEANFDHINCKGWPNAIFDGLNHFQMYAACMWRHDQLHKLYLILLISRVMQTVISNNFLMRKRAAIGEFTL